MKFVFTEHAKDAMRSRKIGVDEVIAVIERGQKWFAKSDGRWHARKGGIEAVFEKDGGLVVVVTCFHER